MPYLKKPPTGYEIYMLCVGSFNVLVGLFFLISSTGKAGLFSLILGILILGVTGLMMLYDRIVEMLCSTPSKLKFNVSADQSTSATDTSSYMGRWKDEPIHRSN